MRATIRLFSFLKPYWVWATLAPLLMMLEVAMDLMQPRLLQRIIDVGIANSDLTVVLQTGLWMVGLAVAGIIGGVGCSFFAVLAAQGFGADLRSALFGRVQMLSFANIDELETGKLITRLTNDVTQVQEVVLMLLRIMVRAPMMMAGSLLMAVIIAPQLAWLFIILIPLVSVGLVLIINRAFPLFSQVQARLDALNTVMQESLAGVRVVKAFVREAHQIMRFGEANDRLMAQNIAAVRTVAVTMPFMMIVLDSGVVAALWFGGVQVSADGMQIGQVIAFINYLMQTLMSLMMVSMLLMRISRSEASAVRVQEVFDSEPAVRNKPDALTGLMAQGGRQDGGAPSRRVAFEDVTFSYAGSEDDPVLSDVSFVAEPGQTVALLGATGSGKSSLVHLIPRFYDVTGGRVTIDGVDVRDIDEATLRRQIGTALQESVLFSGTIRDNIRYGRPDASDEEVIAAAKLAQAHDFISALPDGYDAVVGQRGANLSGGQKQRIAIARALLIRPAILILDDSTSAVDVETEGRIQDALDALNEERTTFVVAQRISTVLDADKILVLDDGRIVAQGDHEELLAASPIYREIYASQLDDGAVSHAAD